MRSQFEERLHQVGRLGRGLTDQYLIARAQYLGQYGSDHQRCAAQLTDPAP